MAVLHTVISSASTYVCIRRVEKQLPAHAVLLDALHAFAQTDASGGLGQCLRLSEQVECSRPRLLRRVATGVDEQQREARERLSVLRLHLVASVAYQVCEPRSLATRREASA